MARTLPLIEAEMKSKGIIKNSIDIFQGGYNRGGVAKSAGTHDRGGVLDVGQYSTAALRVWRSWGVIMWHRTPAQGFMHHGHGVWHDCPHQSAGAQNQVAAYFRGRNGLANNGPDDGPKKLVVRWQDRIKQGVPAAPRPAPQRLGDFWNPFAEITAGAGRNPHGVVLYGISDDDLRNRLIAHGFRPEWYRGNLAWLLADFARSVTVPLTGIQMIGRLREAPNVPAVRWVDYRQQWEAAMNRSGVGSDRNLSIHSVRALQSGLTNFGIRTAVDGIYGPATRKAMTDFQVKFRGARAGTPSADGTVGANDAIHLGLKSDPQPGGVRTRHFY